MKKANFLKKRKDPDETSPHLWFFLYIFDIDSSCKEYLSKTKSFFRGMYILLYGYFDVILVDSSGFGWFPFFLLARVQFRTAIV